MTKIVATIQSAAPSFLQIFTGPRQTIPLWKSRLDITDSTNFIEMALCRLTWTLGHDIRFCSEAEQRVHLHPLPPEDAFAVEGATHIGLGALMKSLSGNFEGAVTRLEYGFRIGPNWDPFWLHNILTHLIAYRFDPTRTQAQTHLPHFQASITMSLDRIQWEKWSGNICAEDIRIDGLLFLGDAGDRKAAALAYDLGSKRLTANRTDHLSYLYLSEAARQLTLYNEAFMLARQGIDIFPNDLRLHYVLVKTAAMAHDAHITFWAREYIQNALGDHGQNLEFQKMSRVLYGITFSSHVSPEPGKLLDGSLIFGQRIPKSRQRPQPPQES